MDLSELVGAAEISERLGKRTTSIVHDWRRRDGTFPAPVLTLKMGHLWLWSDVERWAIATGRMERSQRR